MAIAFPPVYLAGVVRDGEAANDRAWRLAPDRVQDLRDVATGIEEGRAGVGCRYLIDHLAGGGGVDVDEEGYVSKLADLERFIDRFADWGTHAYVRDWRSRLARSRRALAKLRLSGDHRTADVLMVAYGHPDPSSYLRAPCEEDEAEDKAKEELRKLNNRPRSSRSEPSGKVLLSVEGKDRGLDFILGPELASLARYVNVVEAHRQEMIRDEARTRPGAVVSMAEYKERFARADRILTSGDALADALRPFHEAVIERADGEGVLSFEARKAARKERQAAHKDRVDGFLREVRTEAREMLFDAERKYRAAWLKSATDEA